jgi:predicted phosphate transport protein (TIGR00153 family)
MFIFEIHVRVMALGDFLMGLASVFRFFLPRDEKFIRYFEQAADNLQAAGNQYVQLAKVGSRIEMIAARDEIKRLEHVGDEITHKIFEELNLSFLTPFDREDIYELTKRMDDVLDLIDHVADVMVLYQIEKLDEEMGLMIRVTVRAIDEIHQSIRLLRQMKYDALRDHIVRVHELENEGDRLYRLFVGKLFAEEKDAIRLLKYNSIYNEMEHAIDKCEDLMNSIESIMLKNA